MNKLYTVLLHFPVSNKNGETITTSITPFDIHDIARSSITFGVSQYFVVNPSPGQKKVVDRLVNFWDSGYGKTYNPNRTEALSIVSHQYTLEDTLKAIELERKKRPLIITTSARIMSKSKTVSMHELSKLGASQDLLLVFGTGWGLCNEVFELSDHILEPIHGSGAYNHLSVRAAAAIILYQLSMARTKS